MTLSRRSLLGSAVLAAAMPLAPARAQAKGIKIGVLTDMSGPYQNVGGQTSVVCTKQAIEDFGASAKGINVEVVAADHQNKPDVAVALSRQWFDRDGVDLIVDVPNSAVGLAVAGVAREKNKVYINSGAATTELTDAQCSPNTVHWTYDTYMLAKSTGGAMVKAGGDSWYFITADYTFGKQLQTDTTTFVTESGGKVLGSISYPFPGTTDFSSFLINAQSSGAKVLGLANAGADTVNSIKQAHEFGLNQSMKLAALLMFIQDVHALGLEVAQGLNLTASFYWDLNDRTRAFTDRVRPKTPNNWPGMIHAGCYAGTLHYLKVVADMGVEQAKADGRATVARMKAVPAEDDCFGKTQIREDGRNLVPAFLFEVKKPSESKKPWDYYKLVATTPADQAARPLAETHCPLVRA
jgi:branched-chain amino acid transport system substrate-binding protein